MFSLDTSVGVQNTHTVALVTAEIIMGFIHFPGGVFLVYITENMIWVLKRSFELYLWFSKQQNKIIQKLTFLIIWLFKS